MSERPREKFRPKDTGKRQRSGSPSGENTDFIRLAAIEAANREKEQQKTLSTGPTTRAIWKEQTGTIEDAGQPREDNWHTGLSLDHPDFMDRERVAVDEDPKSSYPVFDGVYQRMHKLTKEFPDLTENQIRARVIIQLPNEQRKRFIAEMDEMKKSSQPDTSIDPLAEYPQPDMPSSSHNSGDNKPPTKRTRFAQEKRTPHLQPDASSSSSNKDDKGESSTKPQVNQKGNIEKQEREEQNVFTQQDYNFARHPQEQETDISITPSHKGEGRHTDVPSDIRLPQQTEQTTDRFGNPETISFIPIQDDPMAVINKRDLWSLRIIHDITKLTSEQRDEPGIHFIYNNYEVFLSKDAYIDLTKRSIYNNFPSQIQKEMEKLVSNNIKQRLKNLFSKINQGKIIHKFGVWNVDIKDIKKEDLST